MASIPNDSETSIIKDSDFRRKINREVLDYRKRLYHYTNLSNFWNIVKSDSFWATESRFSNDAEERIWGMKIGRDKLDFKDIDNDLHTINHFVVCFCDESDILSQWRGYATGGGVSIGLDLGMTLPYTVFLKPEPLDKSPFTDTDNCGTCYTRPFKVIYLDKETDKMETVRRILGSDNREISEEQFTALLPFVKHNGFKEEKEWRLVFEEKDFNSVNMENFHSYINYRLDDDRKQVPFICVRPGNVKHEKNECRVRIQTDTNIIELSSDKINGVIQEKVKSRDGFQVFECVVHDKSGTESKLDDTYCFGCSNRKWKGDLIASVECRHFKSSEEWALQRNPEVSIIYISQGRKQEEIFNALYEYVGKLKNHKVKIWCEGHLPIREIVVGPCVNQQDVIESIRHFCLHSNKYWLRCVDVKGSEIPYRTPVAN